MDKNQYPIIGITGTFCTGEHKIQMAAVAVRYVEAVRRAGGLPLIIPPDTPPSYVPALLGRVDGFLLSGGGDIAPAQYGGKNLPSIHGVKPKRDALEIELVRAAVEQKVPFLGICRGIQVVNVALGGDLYGDIATQAPLFGKHNYNPTTERTMLAHRVEIEPTSKLAQILGGTEYEVNSLHHQGVHKVAAGVKVAAKSPEGLVEGIEVVGHPFGIAVQWHPEWLEQDHPAMQALFRALVEASRSRLQR